VRAKAKFFANLIVAVGSTFTTAAFAATFYAECDTCDGPNGPIRAQAAVNLAIANNAAVGDDLVICKHNTQGNAVYSFYTVTYAPVTTTSDISFQSAYSDVDSPCSY